MSASHPLSSLPASQVRQHGVTAAEEGPGASLAIPWDASQEAYLPEHSHLTASRLSCLSSTPAGLPGIHSSHAAPLLTAWPAIGFSAASAGQPKAAATPHSMRSSHQTSPECDPLLDVPLPTCGPADALSDVPPELNAFSCQDLADWDMLSWPDLPDSGVQWGCGSQPGRDSLSSSDTASYEAAGTTSHVVDLPPAQALDQDVPSMVQHNTAAVAAQPRKKGRPRRFNLPQEIPQANMGGLLFDPGQCYWLY